MAVAKQLAKLSAPFARGWYALTPGARILMYHRVTDDFVLAQSGPDQLSVSPSLFARQINWLKQHRNILPLAELLERLQNNTAGNNAIALTFDDGYLDNLSNALPILEQHNTPATIYITTHFASQQLRHPRYANEPGRLHLNWQEIRTLAQHPLIEIGSHTQTHPMLSELPAEQAAAEIQQSKAEIEQQLDQAIASFCYPAGNFSSRDYQLVQQSEYYNAVSVKPGVNRVGSDYFALKRTEITYKDDPDNLSLKLCGAYDLLHQLLDMRREKQFAQQRKLKNR